MPLADVAGMAVQLPPESATYRALHPDDWQWGLTEQLLAATVDELRYLQFLTARAAGDKRAKAPDPIERPGVTSKDKDRIGAGEGFDTPEQWEAWRATRAGYRPPTDDEDDE